MIIIGTLIFLAVVVATLAITLPLTLRNHDEQANNTTSSNNSTITTPSVSNNETNTASMYDLYENTVRDDLINYLFIKF
jgi:predicted secreted protein